MADFEYSVDGKVAVMRFNRPEKLNAISYEMLALIEDAVKQIGSDDNVRAVVVTGTGRAFSAGTDLQQLAQGAPSTARVEGYAKYANSQQPAPWTLAAIQKPVIGAINGAAVGLGAEFTLQCDLRIAGESARFGWVFVHRGLVPDTGAGTWLLARVVGLQNAAHLLYSGEIISAQRAKEIGYVLDVVPDAELMDRAMALAASVSKGGPQATAESKRLLYQGLTRDPLEHLKDHSAVLNGLFKTEDHKEGVMSFIEHRDPVWKNR
ncbi:MAG: enoyl-CoA hydratase/isomerase family protein [Dehalococcoidia bacterium]|nr:enoyl-CoA hydratase/isomerase family protein [Dehalococcoidia bacterium]